MRHINTLKANLQEIYHAVHTPSLNQINLVANLSGTRLYDSTQGWGRIWKWIYSITAILCDNGLRHFKVKKAIIYTYALFQKNLQEIQHHAFQYQTYLKKSSHGYATNEHDYFKIRQDITNWNDATRPFVKAALGSKKEIIGRLFKSCHTMDLSEANPSTTKGPLPFSYSEFDPLGNYQKIIDLEGILNGPLPLTIFEKVSKNKELNETDKRQLDRWIKKLNSIDYPVRKFHQALQVIISTLNAQSNDDIDQADLARLEIMLEEKGCKIFQEEDPKHISWREKTLRKGTKLQLDDQEIVLGDQIGKKILGNDTFIHFTIEQKPNLLLLSGNNQAILELKKNHHRLEKGYGVEPIAISGIFDDGRWAVVEKLRPINSYSWTSTNSTLSADDEFFARPLVQLMKWLIEQNHTPSCFSPKYLMLNNKLQLRSLKPTSKEDFNFNALEDFAYQCSAGNIRIFQYLMEQSSLFSHLTSKFYHEVMANALKNNPTHSDDLAGIYNIDDPKIVDRAAKLVKEVLNLKQQCCFKILEKYPQRNPKEVEQHVNQSILQHHLTTKSAGILWPHLFEKIVA